MSYSDDLRQTVLHAVDTQSRPKAQLARLLGVSLSFVKRVVRRRNETGSARALPHGGGTRPRLDAEQLQAVRDHLAAYPATLLRELAAWLQQQFGVALSLPALSRLLRKLGLPRKKERTTPPSATRRKTRHGVLGGGPRLRRSTRRGSSLSTKAG